VPNFTGRAEELARLSRWAADPSVRLIGVTAWGGAGKTALVTEWLDNRNGAAARPGTAGTFAWSFYANASAERWADALLEWAARHYGFRPSGRRRPGAAVLALLEAVPLALVLDGLEMVQEGPAEGEFGRLLDGTLREVLTGACQIGHQGLVVLTSRFPFADVERFDGGAARMLDVPPFTPAEGAGLLAASGGGWLPEHERQEFVAMVDGHALAVAALGAVLADRPPTDDLIGLRTELAEAAGTNSRVAKVLNFYSTRLAEADRYLVAAVALFAHPVKPSAVLIVAGHEAFGGRLSGWTVGRVEAAACDRLTGLLAQHPDGTLSAHPLVRDAFRPLALKAAEVAADVTLSGLPEGRIANREDALPLVETIELLIAAGHWQAADDLYSNRSDNGAAWVELPAARLGQRAASAFVATMDRRARCGHHLGHTGLAFYLNNVALQAFHCGDLMSALEYVDAAISDEVDSGDQNSDANDLMIRAACLGRLGDIDAALQAAEQAAALAAQTGDEFSIIGAATCRGWLLMQAGDTLLAEEQFLAAERMERADGYESSSSGAFWWADLLVRTGRKDAALELVQRGRSWCRERGWNDEVARCDLILGSLDLAAGDPRAAMDKVAGAVVVFRDGDRLVDLAESLPLLAGCAVATSDLHAAGQHVVEVLNLAAPRGLVLAQAAALAVRAGIHADRVAAGDPAHLGPGRDAAEAAHRLALRHRLAWHELDALEAHALLDTVEGRDRGWAAKAAARRARLIPAGLDPNPLAGLDG
jgi:tetratricopeptide (TPR) repeat protein